MALPFDRSTVRALLVRWERGDAGWEDTVDAADALLGRDLPELGRRGEDAIALEAMGIAARLHHEYLVRSDVPALVRFLDTPVGSEDEGWAALDAFFAGLDTDTRAQTWPEGA